MSEETVTITRAEYEELQSLKQKNEELTQQIQYLLEEFNLAQKHRFGTSSEKNKVNNISQETIYQLGFVFNESEAYSDAVIRREAAGETTVKEHKRKKYVTNLDNLPENIEVEVIDKDLSESERICDQCGRKMTEIGVDIDRKVKILPAKFIIVEIRTHSYKCIECDKTNAKSRIVRPEADKPVIPNGNATAEAIAYIAAEKYIMHSPLYRLEQQLNAAGIPLSRQTMSNWLLKSTELYFEPIWERMKEKLLKENILHADETTLEVLREPDRKAQSKSYMWLYRTGKEAKQQLILYDYQETREAKHPKAFLDGFKGYLHTDGYPGYHNLSPDIRVVGCLAHARRNFTDAVDVIRNEEKRSASPAMIGIAYFDKLFEIEREIASLSPEERKQKRQELSLPILTELRNWVNKLNAPPKSLLGKAAAYVISQWSWLTAWLEDGRLEISNNLAERSIKPFVIGRKNFLFANTPSGARSSAILFSMIQTAKENGLDPYRYLTWVLKKAPYLNMSDPSDVDTLLPTNAPGDCRSGNVPA